MKKATLEGLRAAAPACSARCPPQPQAPPHPHLRIVFDESVERGDRIDRLLREARARGAAAGATPDAAPDGEGEK